MFSATNINLFWQSNIFAPQEKVVDFVDENNNWMKEQVGKNSDNNDDDSSYWNQVHVLLQQLQGLTDGYNDALNNNNPKSPTYLSYEQLQYLQLQVELGDIEKAVDETTRYNFSNMSSDAIFPPSTGSTPVAARGGPRGRRPPVTKNSVLRPL